MEDDEALLRLDLIRKIENEEGPVRDAEIRLARLKELDPFFDGSDFMLQLEAKVRSRRKSAKLSKDLGSILSREQLADIVRIIKQGQGTEVELDAWHRLIRQSVPHPNVSGLIHFPHRYGLGRNPTAEEIVEAAFNYQPIILGPGPENRLQLDSD